MKKVIQFLFTFYVLCFDLKLNFACVQYEVITGNCIVFLIALIYSLFSRITVCLTSADKGKDSMFSCIGCF